MQRSWKETQHVVFIEWKEKTGSNESQRLESIPAVQEKLLSLSSVTFYDGDTVAFPYKSSIIIVSDGKSLSQPACPKGWKKCEEENG
jgi:hypothetical protein